MSRAAAATCLAASRAMSRTSTVVSTARRPFLYVSANALIHVVDSDPPASGPSENGAVDVFRTELAGAPEDDAAILFIPLQDGARAEAKLAADLGGHGNLPL